MRPTTTIALLLIAGLALAPLAAAQGHTPNPRASDGQAKAQTARANHTNHSDDGDHDNKSGKHNATRFAAYHARLAELVKSWLENATAIRDRCHAAEKPGNNTTKENHTAWAHCIRDGYKTLHEQLRAERREARADRWS